MDREAEDPASEVKGRQATERAKVVTRAAGGGEVSSLSFLRTLEFEMGIFRGQGIRGVGPKATPSLP